MKIPIVALEICKLAVLNLSIENSILLDFVNLFTMFDRFISSCTQTYLQDKKDEGDGGNGSVSLYKDMVNLSKT